MSKIVECVPNYSISKELDILEEIVAPFKNKDNVTLISVEPDENYNRTVVTVVGEPQAVKQAMVESCLIATCKIDMRKHHGEHKRMGAVDVVPFIPVSEMSIEEAITLSEECAKEMHESCGIPIFLYNLSAKRDQCRNLPDIRKGEFEGMSEKLKDPFWKPDFGDTCHISAGVTAVGCRPFLIAFNIDLKTQDRSIAARIAKAIRFSNGGYRYIQAGPAVLEDKGIVQVTMNVTDYTKTSVYRAFEAVKMEAKRFSCEVIGSEFIGLISLACLKDIVAYYEGLSSSDEVTYSMKECVSIANKNLLLHGFDEMKVIESYVK
ncbi:MAG: glutamate formimidoyltransferase [Erysipelotrichaceae bacterium]